MVLVKNQWRIYDFRGDDFGNQTRTAGVWAYRIIYAFMNYDVGIISNV